MIDTVSLRHIATMPKPDELNALGFFSACGHGDSQRYISNPPKGSHLPRLTWSRRDAVEWLTAEVSLPKFYCGDNVRSLNQSEIGAALGSFQAFVEAKAQTDFDAETALVGRVDYCNNFQLENESDVKAYLKAFQRITRARYSRRIENDSTVTFFNKSRVTTFYSKYEEALAKEDMASIIKRSNGVLRLETRLMKGQAVARHAGKLGVERLGKSLLTADIASKTLNGELQKLGADKVVVTASTRAEKLVQKFGTKATDYLGFLVMLDQFGMDFYKYRGISKATYFRRLAELREAGLLVTSERELSALRVRQG